MTVSEFLRHVRRIVVDFVVGRVLSRNGDGESASGLDDVTTYYLLHRKDFGMGDMPAGACILYAVSCGLSDSALVDQFDVLARSGKQVLEDEEDEDSGTDESDLEPQHEVAGNMVKLKAWHQRTRKGMGYEAAPGRPIPLIDQAHRLMHLWKAGNELDVDQYLGDRGLRRNHLFHQLIQALIELAPAGSDERSILESVARHIAGRGAAVPVAQERLAL